MYYTMYANERLAIKHWDYYNEVNWLLVNLLTKHYDMDIDDMVDFYLVHRNERHTDDDDCIGFSAQELLSLKEEWDEYQKQKFYYEDYMEDYNDSDDDLWGYENSYMAYNEFNYNEYLEKFDRYFRDRSFVKKLENGEITTLSFYEFRREGDTDDDIAYKFEKRIARNKRMRTKLREVDSVSLYRSDFEAIEKVKKDFGLTELQTQVVFGLIFMSRMNGVKYCRIGTAYKSKGFWNAFDKHIPLEDRQVIWETGLFEHFESDKAKARKQLDNHYESGFADYLHITDESDKIYTKFDIQDEVVWTFHTTVENNKLNFSELCRQAMPNLLKNRYCSVCGKEFEPTNNRQKQCPDCREEHKKEQARLRKQKQRAIKKGLIEKEPKKKKLNDYEFQREWEREQSRKAQAREEEALLKGIKEKPWLYC